MHVLELLFLLSAYFFSEIIYIPKKQLAGWLLFPTRNMLKNVCGI